MQKADIIIIGAGISGAVLAEKYAALRHKKVLIIDKRGHIGGNCYDYYDSAGLLVPKYGPHFFHTNDVDVWNYVSRFTKWHPYEHRVLGSVHGLHVPVPVNINTVNILLKTNIKNEKDMALWLKKNQVKIKKPKNSEEMALSRVGKELYDLLFKPYTKKQWAIHPKELDASVLSRIPVHASYDDRYFKDRHQAMPRNGYTKLFEKMLNHPNITIRLNTNYFDVKKTFAQYEKLFFTGPIDQFFGYKFKKRLQYRSLRFEYQTLNMEYFQSRTQINYPSDNDFTRINEPKHATGQKSLKTTIIREYSVGKGEPYYPIPTKRNRAVYALYQKEAKKLEKENIYFVGRLANYKYFNMDQAFRNALDLFHCLEGL